MKKTVLVAATVPTSVRTLLAPQIAAMAERGYRVEVVTSSGDPALKELVGLSEVHLIRMTREISPLADVVALFKFMALVSRVRPGAIVTFSPKASLLGLISAWILRVPSRVYSTGGLRLETARGWSRKVMWFTEWLTCASSTRVVANSPSLARVYADNKLGLSKTSWTMSRKGVDCERFAPSAVRLSTGIEGPPGLPVVGFVGRITTDKGVPVLAQALSILESQDVGLRLVIVGPWESDESASLIELVRKSTPYVTAAGHTADVRPYYAAMDVFVLPSGREGFPNVVLEAAAMALPAIVTDATGCIDSVDPNTGMVVPNGDPVALASAIRTLVEDEDLRSRLGMAARDRCVRNFTPALVVAEQLRLMGLDGAGDDARSESGRRAE